MTCILAADIGGTTSRFGVFSDSPDGPVLQGSVFSFSTRDDSICSFNTFLDYYQQHKPNHMPSLHDVSQVILAVPGPVSGLRCPLPNIDWNIDLNAASTNNMTLLNDFTAQACACVLPEVINKLILIKGGPETTRQRIAIIGAGTGLGHCCLVFNGDKIIPVPSEAGYACFAFNREKEKKLEQFMLSRINTPYLVNDMVVSGNGLSLLYEFFTGQCLSAEGIFNDSNNKETLEMFSCFYGRVCRNYCLTNAITGKLIVSGGIAIKHPELIMSDSFMDEFIRTASPAYDALLNNLPVYLNPNEDIGLIGAAGYGLGASM